MDRDNRSSTTLKPNPSTLVYVIEDDEALGQIIEKVLVTHGFQVRSFALAETALEALEEARQLEQVPAIILLDYRMPQMNGAEFVRRKVRWEKRHSLQVPTVLMTAERRINPEDFPEGIQEILHKPPDISELLDTVRRLSTP